MHEVVDMLVFNELQSQWEGNGRKLLKQERFVKWSTLRLIKHRVVVGLGSERKLESESDGLIGLRVLLFV